MAHRRMEESTVNVGLAKPKIACDICPIFGDKCHECSHRLEDISEQVAEYGNNDIDGLWNYVLTGVIE